MLKAHLLHSFSSTLPLPDLSLTFLNLSLHLHLSPSPSDDEKRPPPVHLSLDWTALLAQVHFIVCHFPFHSLDSLAFALSSYLCTSDLISLSPLSPSPISHVSLTLSLHHPPSTLTLPPLHSSTSTSSLPPPTREFNPWGYVDVIAETTSPSPSAGLYLLHLSAGQSIPLHHHLVMNEAELILSDGLLCQGEVSPWGVVHRWGTSPHCYHNPTPAVQAVLCVDSPAFIRTDEIEVEGSPAKDVPHSTAGQELWKNTARPLLEREGGEGGGDGMSFVFPGCYEGQTCRLMFAPTSFVRAHAVLVLMMGREGEGEVVCVHHRVRGWEVPGGKVEDGEGEVEAAVRELEEEAGVRVQPHQLTRIAQYHLTQGQVDAGGSGESSHVKSVYMGEIMDAEVQDMRPTKWRDTDAAEMKSLPSLTSLSHKGGDSGWSPLVSDNVLTLCMQVAKEVRRCRALRSLQ